MTATATSAAARYMRRTPYPHQERAFDWAADQRAGMLAIAMGGMKSAITIALLEHDRGLAAPPYRVLVLAPKSVVDVWPNQLAEHAVSRWETWTGDVVGARGKLKNPSVARRAEALVQATSLAAARRAPFMAGVNYEAAHQGDMGRLLLGTPWDAVILDECVPPGTPISTPDGDRRIADLAVGDPIYGYEDGRVVVTRVRAVMARRTRAPLVDVGTVATTPGHPVWTANRGYVPAGAIRPTDLIGVVYAEETAPCPRLRMVWRALHGTQADQSLLLETVLDDLARHSGNARALAAGDERDPQPAGSAGEARCAPGVVAEPGQGPRGAREGACGLALAGIPITDRGEWARPDGTPAPTGRGDGLADGTRRADRPAAESGTSDALQAGHRGTVADGRDRGGRAQSHDGSRGGGGRSQGGVPALAWLDSAALLQSFGDDGHADGAQGHHVHNIETGTGNYFAGGVLVHNCHRLKSPSGKASRAAAAICERVRARGGRILQLTGTPMPHSPLDLWAQVRALDGGRRLGTSYHRFCVRYGRGETIWAPGGIQRTVFKGVRDDKLAELTSLVGPLMFQVTEDELADILGLEEPIDVHRTVELDPTTRRAYDELETDLITRVGDGVITAANAMVLVLRLAQVASGLARDAETGEPLPLPNGLPEKARLLADVLEDLPVREPVVVFCRFHHDLDAVRAVAEKQGRRYGELSGRRRDGLSDRATMAEDIDVLGCQIKSGGVGIDLTRARYGIYYTLGFELADYLQSRKRLHRPGQTRPVVYTHLLASDSIEQSIYGALRQRQTVVDAVLSHLQGATR